MKSSSIGDSASAAGMAASGFQPEVSEFIVDWPARFLYNRLQCAGGAFRPRVLRADFELNGSMQGSNTNSIRMYGSDSLREVASGGKIVRIPKAVPSFALGFAHAAGLMVDAHERRLPLANPMLEVQDRKSVG